MREIVLDTETTGISPLEGHRIIEIGMVELVNKYRTGKTLQFYINPEREVSEGAVKVHGITTEFLKDKPKFKEVVADVIEFIGDSKLVIHNASFDLGFLNHHFHQLGIPPIHDDKTFCTLLYARKKYPGAKNSLDALCNRFNIDLAARVNHGALLDAELLADVYAEMMGAGATQRNLQFAAYTGNAIAQIEEQEKIERQQEREFHAPREFALTEAELTAHEEFVSKLKDPLWKKVA